MSFTQSCSAGREQSLKPGTSKLISTGRLFLTLIESPGEELENFFLNYKFKAIRSHSSALR